MGGDSPSVLLTEARQGSEDALNDLFQNAAPRLLAIIRLRLGPTLRARLESQDILQSTLLKAFTNIDGFAGSGSNTLVGWLATIAANEIRDQAQFHGRQQRDMKANVPIDEELRPLEASIRDEVSRLALREKELRLEQALEELSDEHREVIILRKFEELSFGEIGEKMGRSADAARMLLARAMATLTDIYGNLLADQCRQGRT